MSSTSQSGKVALVMAGGTGGHIFPGLAVAQELIRQGWDVHWLGSKSHMEWDIIRPLGIAFESVEFSGVRGKGLVQLMLAPWRLVRACWQALRVLRKVRPHVLLGFGGYITVPAGLMCRLTGTPLILHEQNSVAGLANKVLARGAARVFSAFPDVVPLAEWVGNPLRDEFLTQAPPAERFAKRNGPLRLLVVGGSLGAAALNSLVPQALALLEPSERPAVLHQSGRLHMDALVAGYQALGLQAEVTPFIQDTAQAFAHADLVICRAGASTVTELAAVGAPALFVPFPHAVDDHQSTNARYLSDHGAAWLMPQEGLSAQVLADFVRQTSRKQLLEVAQNAHARQKLHAVQAIVQAANTLTS
jgi:UDP-N-acetylglucosamine--N-acetylmuramyl-(pentapeptide) pyrophosphoryl-undecaprenol N-acetylglucosamine transferase